MVACSLFATCKQVGEDRILGVHCLYVEMNMCMQKNNIGYVCSFMSTIETSLEIKHECRENKVGLFLYLMATCIPPEGACCWRKVANSNGERISVEGVN